MCLANSTCTTDTHVVKSRANVRANERSERRLPWREVEIDQAARERGDNAEAAERIAERQTFVEEGLGELKGDLVEGIEAVRGELDAAAEDLRDAAGATRPHVHTRPHASTHAHKHNAP